MKISIGVGGYGRSNTSNMVEFVQEAERLGVDAVWSAEAWGNDAVTSLAFLAGQTERIHLGTGIMQISARVPAMTAMTALSLNTLSNGRFRLGLGASGPQVVEGLHGVPYAAPLTRLKETVQICRLAFAGEKLEINGKKHVLPLPDGEGKALRLDQPVSDIPIYLATLGPKALEFTGAAADGWLGTSFSPEHCEAHFEYLRRGAESAGRTLADLDICAAVSIAVGDNVEELIDSRRANVAFQMGAMGSAETNFYNEAFQRAGYEEDAKAIQALWIEGKRDEAARRVPDAMITEFQAIGTRDMVLDRLKKYRDVGVTSLNVRLDAAKSRDDRYALLEECVAFAGEL